MDTPVVVSAFIRSDHAGPLLFLRKVRLCLEHPRHEGVVGFTNSGSPGTFGRHVAKRGTLVNRERGEPRSTEFHASVERQFLASVVC